MALQSSGPISIGDIQAEFGGTNPASFSEYYRGGPYVPNSLVNAAIPTSGLIGLGDFHGSANEISQSFTLTAGQTQAAGKIGIDTFGYANGIILQANVGSISPIVFDGVTIRGLFGTNFALNIYFLGNHIGSPAFTSITINGATLFSADATSVFAEPSTVYSWLRNSGFSNGGVYAGIITK
ncbi:MAG: hypothetical protein COA62_15615 [Rhodobiaceae bacterium]|nr:MAG: hypothetical protein COA62_15615 [Rhodobiaceae bacterium]